jgi:uncharacterized protein (DUF1800 family)
MQKIKHISIITLLIVSTLATAQTTSYNLTDVVSISTQNTEMHENWSIGNTIIVRRTGGIKAITIPFDITGTAIMGTDFQSVTGNTITIPMGKREVWITLKPLPDNLTEGDETLRFTLQASSSYTISGSNFTEITIKDQSSTPSDQEAARFLMQAGFGADADEIADVKAMGFEGWINNQLTRPKGYIQPEGLARLAMGISLYGHEVQIALWKLIMRRRYPTGAPAVATDILRQRVAYSLSQIFVVSQKSNAISNHNEGIMNYHDRLMDGAFGNFEDLLRDVALHPIMGDYLSHRFNRKANPVLNTFPDENFAREIMQLFSIGLWQLNPDGSRILDTQGQPIPTYNNTDIREFAKVFTGLNFGGPQNTDPDNFYWPQATHVYPMRGYEAFHDTTPKNLLGTITQANQTTLADVNAAVNVLFNHPNTGPFIGKQLIMRLVTSNPSPAYVARVSAKFANNGNGVRGDMGAVIKQILLDPEARDFSHTLNPYFGKMKEPFVHLLSFAKTFECQPPSNDFGQGAYKYDILLQQPYDSPSVFNFYKPNYSAQGVITATENVSPEFQILTATSAISAHNLLQFSVDNEIATWSSNNANSLIPKYTSELPLASNPDRLIQQLATKIVGANLHPRNHQIIYEAVTKITTNMQDWQLRRAKMATFLLETSVEGNILK